MNYNFEKAFSLMDELEGGAVLHQNPTEDAVTYYGIYRKYHDTWKGWFYVDKGEHPPVELVKEFYKKEFWDKIKGDELPEGLSLTMFDFAVNSDPTDAGRVLQKTIGTTADGIIGSGTLSTLKTYLQKGDFAKQVEKLVLEVNAQRLHHMMSGNYNDLQAYGEGWSRRVCRVLQESLKEVMPF